MISAVIITYNEAENIRSCLESLEGVVDEIIVVDAESEDETVAICAEFRVRIFQRKWEGYAKSKNFGNSQASHSYILSIDADESLSEELSEVIIQLKARLSGAYQVSRKNIYCGQWIKHCGWYPDLKVRLFPKDQARWTGAYVHEILKLDEGIEKQTLKGDLIHRTNKNLEDHLERIQRYAELHAQALFAKDKRANWVRLWIVPLYRFFRMYILQGGFRDGYLGFQLCKVSAFAVFLKYAKLKRLWDEQA